MPTVHLKNQFWKISLNYRYFKVHLHEIFYLGWFGQTNPDYCSKIFFFIFVSNSPRYSTFYAFCIFPVYGVHTDSFRVFSVYYVRTDSFVFLVHTNRFIRILDTYEQIHSTYYLYANRFILHIRRMPRNNFKYSEFNIPPHSF